MFAFFWYYKEIKEIIKIIKVKKLLIEQELTTKIK